MGMTGRVGGWWRLSSKENLRFSNLNDSTMLWDGGTNLGDLKTGINHLCELA